MYTTKAKPLRLKLSTDTQNPKKVHANTLNPVKSTINLLLFSTALQLLVQSFGLSNHFLPSSSILDKSLPIWHF